MFADTDMFQSLLYLLQSEDFYNEGPKAAKNTITQANTYATFVAIGAIIFLSDAADINDDVGTKCS